MVLRKLSQTFKITLALMLSVLSSGILQVAPAFATTGDNGQQVFVCKYVGKPGVNETLKDGKNPISVSSNATVGTYFNDAQGRSYVLSVDNTNPGPQDDPDVSECPPVDNGDNEVTPLPSGISDVCGPNNDTVPSTDTATYTVEEDSDWVDNLREVTYQATGDLVFSESEGWVVSSDGKMATYTYKDWGTTCPTGPTGVLEIDTACKEITLSSTMVTPLGGVVTYEIDDVSATAGTSVVNPGVHKVELFVNGTEVDEKSVSVERCPTQCTVTSNVYLDAWTYDGDTYPTTDGSTGSYTFKADGLHLNTPDTDSTVYGLIDAGSTPIADVDAMSYETFRKTESAGHQYTAPAYVLAIDTNGAEANGLKYFFYEPYNNASPLVQEGEWQMWNTLNGGDAKWWMSGTGQTLRTWDYFVAEYPDAVVLAYGFNQGTSNAETFSIVQDIEFDCATTSFSKGNVLPVDDTKTPPAPTTPTPVTPGKTLSASTELPATLPATGGSTSPFTIIIASLMAYGAAYFLQGRRLMARNEA